MSSRPRRRPTCRPAPPPRPHRRPDQHQAAQRALLLPGHLVLAVRRHAGHVVCQVYSKVVISRALVRTSILFVVVQLLYRLILQELEHIFEAADGLFELFVLLGELKRVKDPLNDRRRRLPETPGSSSSWTPPGGPPGTCAAAGPSPGSPPPRSQAAAGRAKARISRTSLQLTLCDLVHSCRQSAVTWHAAARQSSMALCSCSISLNLTSSCLLRFWKDFCTAAPSTDRGR